VRSSRGIGDLLVATTRSPDGAPSADLARLVDAVDVAEFVRAVAHHRVVGPVWRALGPTSLLDDDAAASLRGLHHAAVARHLLLLEGLAVTADALDGGSIPWLAFKGPVLAELVYARADERAYTDLDVLVPPSRLADAVAALERGGARLLDANWRLIADALPGELHLLLPSGGVLDLHWHVVCERDARRQVAFPTDAVFARSERREVAGRAVPVMDPVDTLVHVALHASLAGADRLVWLKDVEQCVGRGGTDWPLVRRRARELGAAVATGLMLARASSVLGVPVPAGVVRDLVPSPGLRWAMRAIDAVWPVQRARPGGSPARLIARAARHDASATRGEAVRRVASWARDGGSDPSRLHARALDAEFEGSLLHPAGTEEDRERYFRAVWSETGS